MDLRLSLYVYIINIDKKVNKVGENSAVSSTTTKSKTTGTEQNLT